MKKFILSLIAILAVSLQANALSANRSRQEARFLTDKMAYELDLTDEQLQDIYEINYDYFRSLGPVNGYYDSYYDRRYRDLSYVLYDWQWQEFLLREYFLRPAYIYHGAWAFGIYNYYARTHFFYGIPHIYHTYRGGHYSHHNYYLGRRDMHYRAVSSRGSRPHHIDARRPQMNRPNIGHKPSVGNRRGNESRNNIIRENHQHNHSNGNSVNRRSNSENRQHNGASKNNLQRDNHTSLPSMQGRNENRSNQFNRESSRSHEMKSSPRTSQRSAETRSSSVTRSRSVGSSNGSVSRSHSSNRGNSNRGNSHRR